MRRQPRGREVEEAHKMSRTSLPRFITANVSAVTPSIFVGGDLDPYDDNLMNAQVDELIGHGVTHVVDCRIEANDEAVWDLAPGVTHLHHGMDDRGQQVPDAWFERGVLFLQEALQDPAAIVLTHCHMGINRGPSLGFALMLAEGWGSTEALTAIRRGRSIAYVAYAEQALRWHHRRSGASPHRRHVELAEVARWRRDDVLDIADVIRNIRGGRR